jgi:molybdopterin adenylyltransferase
MSIRIGIITISDRSSKGERSDESGPALANIVTERGWLVERTLILPDEMELIKNTLIKWSDSGELDVILTTGGTGFSPRDITPEATLAVVDRLTPGLNEAMRMASLRSTPHAMLSRASSGIRAHTLIINLPGSPRGAGENLSVILSVLPHAVKLLQGDPAAELGHQGF